MKKIISTILLMMVVVSTWAYDFAKDGIFYLKTSSDCVAVTFKDAPSSTEESYSGDVVIPSQVTYQGTTYSVTSVYTNAFYNDTKVTSISIPNSVTSIGLNAISKCTGLTGITMGNSVTTIGNHSFDGCTSLTSITIPNSVTSIGESAFEGCSKLASVSIGNSVKTIGGASFAMCTGLTSVVIPNSVTKIEGSAFSCSGLTSVTIGKSVSSIADGCFADCSQLSSIIVIDGNTTYDSRDNCNAIIKTSTNALILGCKTTKIPNTVNSIGDYAFCGCTGLTSVNLPNSISSIGQYAFNSCSGITTAIIPNSVLELKSNSFDGCSSLVKVYCFATNVPQNSAEAFGQIYLGNSTLYVPSTSLTSYQDADGWKYFGSILPISSAKETINLTASKTYTTYCNPTFALDFTNNAKVAAYKAKYDETNKCVVFNRVDKIPAGTGVVLLNRTNASIALVNLVENATELTDNALIGTTTATQLTYQDNGKYNYVLSSGKFFPIANNSTIAAGKAYLSIAYDATVLNAKALSVVFDNTETPTTISKLTEDRCNENSSIYTIGGVRVAKPSKGIYIINGKKVVY